MKHSNVSILHDGVDYQLSLLVGTHVVYVELFAVDQVRNGEFWVQFHPVLHHELTPPVAGQCQALLADVRGDQGADAGALDLLHALDDPAGLLVHCQRGHCIAQGGQHAVQLPHDLSALLRAG